MYKLEVYSEEKNGSTSLLSPKEIQTQIQFIMDDADKRVDENGCEVNPAIFTGIDRTKWAKVKGDPAF